MSNKSILTDLNPDKLTRYKIELELAIYYRQPGNRQTIEIQTMNINTLKVTLTKEQILNNILV